MADTVPVDSEPVTGTAYPMNHRNGPRSINVPPGVVPFALGVVVTLAIMWAVKEMNQPRRRAD